MTRRRTRLPGPPGLRSRAAGLALALLVVTSGCGTDGADDLAEQLARVDTVVAAGDSSAARAELSALQDLVETLESDGTVSARNADDIAAAIDDLLAALPDDPAAPAQDPTTTSPVPTEEPEVTEDPEDDSDEDDDEDVDDEKEPKEPKEPKPPKEPKDDKDKGKDKKEKD